MTLRTIRNGLSVTVLLLLLATFSGTPQAFQLIEELKQTVVSIWKQNKCIGTGFLISPDGYLLTNEHVVDWAGEATEVQVGRPDGPTAKVVRRGSKSEAKLKDVALLHLEGVKELRWAKLGNSDRVKETDRVTAIGFPEPEKVGCREPSISGGEVTKTDASTSQWGSGLLQIAAPLIQPGSSGSPVFNSQGEVVGIIVGGIPGGSPFLYYAIPSEMVIEAVIKQDPSFLPRDYAPEITFIEFPEGVRADPREILADGNFKSGKIGFRDVNANLAIVRFEILEGEVIVSPKLEIVSKDLLDKVKGEFPFALATTKPQEQVRLNVTLIDLDDNMSKPPTELRFRVKPFGVPEVTFVRFPEEILADGRENDGQVGFRDVERDIVGVLFKVRAQQPDAVIFKPARNFDPGVRGKEEGMIPFSISSTIHQEVIFTVTLIDAKGQESQPAEKRFMAKRKTSTSLIANFTDCRRPSLSTINWGSFYTPGKGFAKDSCISDPVNSKERGQVIKEEYDVSEKSFPGIPKSELFVGFWLQWVLDNFDPNKCQALSIFLRGDEKSQFTTRLKVELKIREQKWGWRASRYINGKERTITRDWQQFTIPLSEFIKLPDVWPPPHEPNKPNEVTITLEAEYVDAMQGIIYIDDIAFECSE